MRYISLKMNRLLMIVEVMMMLVFGVIGVKLRSMKSVMVDDVRVLFVRISLGNVK